MVLLYLGSVPSTLLEGSVRHGAWGVWNDGRKDVCLWFHLFTLLAPPTHKCPVSAAQREKIDSSEVFAVHCDANSTDGADVNCHPRFNGDDKLPGF